MIPSSPQTPVPQEQRPPAGPPKNTRLKQKLRFLGQLTVLTAIYLVGNQVASLTSLPIPGNVIGVMLLYALLNLGILRLDQVQDAADFLLRHLVFFFIPVAVDLMNWGGLFWKYGLMLALAIVASTATTYLGTGWLAQRLRSREESCPNS
ncbi:MAG: LrgA family protein [Holophagaceae bacterium]|nr:LrgA family protein [Holophagaceae bacterium]